MIVVGDTGPINYLILIDEIDLLASLYQRVVVPVSVREELAHARTPEKVRAWIADYPAWLEVRAPAVAFEPGLAHLDKGERDAILLAEELQADQLIIDEMWGRREARRRQLRFTGTLGVLAAATDLGLVDLRSAVNRLRETSFYVSDTVLNRLLGGS